MKRIAGLFCACLFLLVSNSVSFAGERIVVCGTGDSQKLLRTLADVFERANPAIEIEVPDSIGSGAGIKATAKGICDLGRVARPLKENERKYGLNYREFAHSPVVFVAHLNKKWLSNITSEQVVRIYSGELRSWDELGGEKKKIYVADREAGDSSRTVLEKQIDGFKDIGILAGKKLYSTPETIATITNYENTIGYVPLAMAKGTDLIVLKFDGVYPSAKNVQRGNYRLVTPLGLVWKGELKEPEKTFVQFLLSPEGQKIITDYGAIPIR